MTEYNPLEVCPAAFKLAQEVGRPEYVGLGLTSAYPIKLWKPAKEIFTFLQFVGQISFGNLLLIKN